ncbi:hypothetical protein B9037_010220 [Klebsiella aerogenes]|nr:hypothetical protein B9037_010220 [Klebsiella aerogenes]
MRKFQGGFKRLDLTQAVQAGEVLIWSLSPGAARCAFPGLRVATRSVAPVSAAPPGRYTPHSKKPRTFRYGVLLV